MNKVLLKGGKFYVVLLSLMLLVSTSVAVMITVIRGESYAKGWSSLAILSGLLDIFVFSFLIQNYKHSKRLKLNGKQVNGIIDSVCIEFPFGRGPYVIRYSYLVGNYIHRGNISTMKPIEELPSKGHNCIVYYDENKPGDSRDGSNPACGQCSYMHCV
jgi:hypothetical protein